MKARRDGMGRAPTPNPRPAAAEPSVCAARTATRNRHEGAEPRPRTDGVGDRSGGSTYSPELLGLGIATPTRYAYRYSYMPIRSVYALRCM